MQNNVECYGASEEHERENIDILTDYKAIVDMIEKRNKNLTDGIGLRSWSENRTGVVRRRRSVNDKVQAALRGNDRTHFLDMHLQNMYLWNMLC